MNYLKPKILHLVTYLIMTMKALNQTMMICKVGLLGDNQDIEQNERDQEECDSSVEDNQVYIKPFIHALVTFYSSVIIVVDLDSDI